MLPLLVSSARLKVQNTSKTDLGKRRSLGEWAIFGHLPDGRGYAQAQPITFVHDPGDPAEELRCWYLADSKEGGNLLSYWLITPFITLSENNRSITVVPRVTIDPKGIRSRVEGNKRSAKGRGESEQ